MWRLKAINLVTTPMVKNMFMMEEEMDKKKEMYVVYAYVMELGSDFIPSDAASEGSEALAWRTYWIQYLRRHCSIPSL